LQVPDLNLRSGMVTAATPPPSAQFHRTRHAIPEQNWVPCLRSETTRSAVMALTSAALGPLIRIFRIAGQNPRHEPPQMIIGGTLQHDIAP